MIPVSVIGPAGLPAPGLVAVYRQGVYGPLSLVNLRKNLSTREPVSNILKALQTRAAEVTWIEEVASEAKPVLCACIAAAVSGPVAIIAYSEDEAERIYEGLLVYGISPERAILIPSTESLLFEDGQPDWSALGSRLKGLSDIALGRSGVYVTPFSAAVIRTAHRADFAASVKEITNGQRLNISRFALDLVRMGYRRADLVTEQGEFGIRGGLIDIWPPTSDSPVRIELFDDEIESIRLFDIESQRSSVSIKQILIPPAREAHIGDNAARTADKVLSLLSDQSEALRRAGRHPDAHALEQRITGHIASIEEGALFNGVEFYNPLFNPDEVCLLDWLATHCAVIWDDPSLCKAGWDRLKHNLDNILRNRAERGQSLALGVDHQVSFERARSLILKHPCIAVSSLPQSAAGIEARRVFRLNSGSVESFGAQVGVFAENVNTWTANGYSTIIFTSQVLRVGQMLIELNVRPIHGQMTDDLMPGVYVLEGNIPSGFKLPDQKIVVVSDGDIFGMNAPRRASSIKRQSRPVVSVDELKEGDYVVHEQHGIGVYRGLVTMAKNGASRDFLFLEYAGGDKLYIPADQTDRIGKYSGSESGPPTIHRIGGSDWARTRKRVKQSVREIAKELIQIYAAREALGGYQYPPDTPWQSEMEEAFPFQETEDQLRAIEEVKQDMEQPRPMDRLVCGDVGFGKTEVAMRAAFKAVLDGRQVAVLCPTTVLAQQHYNVFSERLAVFPVKVEMLSRFRSHREQTAILDELRAGNIDVIIGTHRLLSKDVEFKNLGLLIVDEEQRFGVTHKERLKQLRVSVDVLTLTATPIPRTLHMSLAGIRDLSVINQAPEGRSPVRTYVREYDDELVREAIVRELDRDGQVFFVHNRVETIQSAADDLRKLVPHARIAIGHGQMGEDELEQVMFDFYHHKYDILVCTTIIESGLDIPRVNTIVINNADKFGLAQLYQLRGRVGRSDRQAHAYLLYKSDEILSEVAERRLSAIREFADLGSGLKIAMRDLEIRGAGNLLGAEQHGQMLSVGFDMYCHLLNEAVRELKGEDAPAEKTLPSVELPIEAYIPETYIESEGLRINIYRKFAACFTSEAASRLEEELRDRFGTPPEPVGNALEILRLRVQADEVGVMSVKEENGRIIVLFAPGVSIEPNALRQLSKLFRQHYWDARRVSLHYDKAKPVETVREFFKLVSKSLIRPGASRQTTKVK